MPKHDVTNGLVNVNAIELLELLKRIDEAVHRATPPGGNANIEQAQALCGDLRRKIEEYSK